MYQAYLDDSGRASGPTYVIAGFLGSAKTWLGFSQKWKELLDGCEVDYFKTKEAMNPRTYENHRSQYYGWPREDIDELIACLTEGICTLVPFRIRITVPNAGYEKTFKGKIGPEADFPYMLAHASAMLESTRFLTAHGFREPIDFIFDSASEREQHAVIQAWHFWKRNEWMKERQALMGNPPVFRDDKRVLPLQAADFYAWHARKERQMLSEGRSYEHPSWKALSAVRGPEKDYTVADLEHNFKLTKEIRDLNKWGPWPYERKAEERNKKKLI